MVRIGPWLSEGWVLFSRHTGAFLLGTLLLIFGSIITCSVLLFPLAFGMNYMALCALRGQPVSGGEITYGFQRFGKALLLWLVSLGMGLFSAGFGRAAGNAEIIISFVVGPFFTIMSGLVGYLIVDRDEEFGMAVSRSFEVVKKDLLTFWVCGLLFGLLAPAGMIVCGVGVLATIPWIACAQAIAYRDLFGTVPGAGVTVEEVPLTGA